jgi:predicted RNA binding protein YcfA (HicA-like mRNA interferase family)
MGEKFPVCTASDVVRVIRRHGFTLTGQKGSHQK